MGHLAPFSHKVENKLRDVAASDWDVFDGAPDDVSFGARNDVGYAVARVDDGSREGAVCDAVGRPGGSESKYGLDGDVEALDVEGFKEDFGSLLAVFGRVEWGFCLYRTVRRC